MSFGQHLEELRVVLFKSLIGIGIGSLIGFIFATQVVAFLTVPLDKALVKFKKSAAVKAIEAEEGYLPPEFSPWLEEERLAPRLVKVDPGQFVSMLRKLSPEFLADVDLTPYRFTADNFRLTKIPDLCAELSDPPSEEKKVLWKLLSSEDQKTIKGLAKEDEPDASQLAEFLAVMNRLAENRKVNESETFASQISIKEPSFWDNFKEQEEDTLPQMAAVLKSEFSDDLNRRVNRVIISRQFSQYCNPLKLEMFDIKIWEELDVKPQSLTATEPFMIWVKAGVITGLILSSPWVFFQIWSFVAAGLYGHEKKYVYLYMPISMLLFFSGVFLAFGFVFEPVLDFLFTFNSQMGIDPIPRVNDWLSFVMFLPLGFGIAFQLPLLMLFLNRIGVFTVEAYTSNWRVAIMIIFFLSMLLTPADPISMILLAVPLTLLYFAGIGFCKWMPKGQNPFSEVPPGETPAKPA